jgi:hypothetical protein
MSNNPCLALISLVILLAPAATVAEPGDCYNCVMAKSGGMKCGPPVPCPPVGSSFTTFAVKAIDEDVPCTLQTASGATIRGTTKAGACNLSRPVTADDLVRRGPMPHN